MSPQSEKLKAVLLAMLALLLFKYIIAPKQYNWKQLTVYNS